MTKASPQASKVNGGYLSVVKELTVLLALMTRNVLPFAASPFFPGVSKAVNIERLTRRGCVLRDDRPHRADSDAPTSPDGEYKKIVHAVIFNELVALNQTIAGSCGFRDYNFLAHTVIRAISIAV